MSKPMVEDFPRGGKKTSKKHEIEKTSTTSNKKGIPDLFKIHSTTEPKGKAPRKRKLRKKDDKNNKKTKIEETEEEEEVETNKNVVIERLFNTAMIEDILILGRVKEVFDLKLKVSLSNGIVGDIAITDICDAFTEKLQSVADDSQKEDECDLHELFEVGSVVRCRVKSITEKKKQRWFNLTINPKDVNYQISAADVRKGMVIGGFVSSIEDHGYIVDLGIKGIQAFVTNKAAEKYVTDKKNQKPLVIGEYLNCLINENSEGGKKRVTQVVIDRDTVESAMTPSTIPFTSLLPGMMLQTTVQSMKVNGLILKFSDMLKCGIHQLHLTSDISSYEIDQKVTACIQYIHPTRKSIVVTTLPHLVSPNSETINIMKEFPHGKIIEKVKVIQRMKKQGLIVKLSKTIKGFVPMTQISDGVSDDNKALTDFDITNRIKCRVLGYDLIDNIVIVSMKQSIIDMLYLTADDVDVGEIIETTIVKLMERCLIVKLSEKLEGYVFPIHYGDLALKHPEKFFIPGGKLKCQVLKKEGNKVILTNKKTLIESELSIVSEMEDFIPGEIVIGYVAKILKKHVLVGFYNNMAGVVPNSELTSTGESNAASLFKTGQVVKCKVLTVQPEEGRVTLSFKLKSTEIVGFSEKDHKSVDKLKMNSLVDCRVTSKSKKGLNVKLISNGLPAIIPTCHLSDLPQYCESMFNDNVYAVGDIIKGAMCWSKHNVITLTLKKSLKKATEIPHQFDDLQLDSCYSGIIKRSELYGAFVALHNDLYGLVLTKNISDGYLNDPSQHFCYGQSVKAKVVVVNEAAKNVQLSLKMSDCFDEDKCKRDAVEILQNCLLERKLILKSVFKGKTKLTKLKTGSIVTAKVGRIGNDKINCIVNSTIPGKSSRMNMKDVRFEKGSDVEAVVLDLDLQTKQLQISLNPKLVKSVKNWKKNLKELKSMNSLNAEILLVKDAYCVVSLTVEDMSVIGFLPVKKHINDLESKLSFKPGEMLSVTVDSTEDDIIVCPKDTKDKSVPTENKKATANEKFQSCMTNVVKCTVVKKTSEVVIVRLQKPAGITGKIPKLYLSDSTDCSDLLFSMYKDGDVIEEAVCYSQQGQDLLLTTKKSIVKAAKDGVLPKSFDQIKCHQVLPGIILNVIDIGCRVQLTNGYCGLVPNRLLSGGKHQDDVLKPLFPVGKSVAVKINEVDAKKRRCIMSLKLKDCFDGDPDIAVEMLENYLQEKQQYFEFAKGEEFEMCNYEVGQIVQAEILKKSESGAVCKVDQSMGAVCIYEQMIGVECQVGGTMEAVVLFVDFNNKCLEISLNPQLVKSVQSRVENKANQVKVGQVLSSEVQLIKPDFALILLKGHAVGKLAYLPAKRHVNDVVEEKSFQIGQVNQVVIKRVDDVVIAGVQHYEKQRAKSTVLPESTVNHNLKIGSNYKAKITKILPYQMNITIGDVPGRVYATEVYDNPLPGTKPFKKFKVSSEIDVVVVGFRSVKTQARLPITHPGVSVSMVDCSLRQSIQSEPTMEGEIERYTHSPEGIYKVGDKVQVFVTENGKMMKVRVTPKVFGTVYILNQSTDLKVLAQPKKKFEVGSICQATVVKVIDAKNLQLSIIDPVDIHRCLVTHCEVIKFENDGVSVLLPNGMMGFAPMSEVGGVRAQRNLKKKLFTQCFVYDQNKQKIWMVSMVFAKVKSTFHQKLNEKQFEDFEEGDLQDAYINTSSENGITVWLSKNQLGEIESDKMCEIAKDLPFGTRVAVKILSLDENEKRIELSMLEEDTGVKFELEQSVVQEVVQRKRTISQCSSEADIEKDQEKGNNLKRKRLLSEGEDDSGVEDIDESVQQNKKNPYRLTLSTDFSWDNMYKPPTTITQTQLKTDDNSSSESDDDEETIVQPVVKKKTKKELKQEKADEEKKIFENEKLTLEGEQSLQTASDYDRLVLQSPNSSIVWIRYMAFHLETAEIDKARAIAERALKTISFREEQEKLNIWAAYMNIENTYGSAEELKIIFDRAIQHSEPFNVYQQLIGIYLGSEKYEAAELLFNSMLKRFSSQKKVWVNFGLFYYKQQRFDSARKLLQRALKCLEKRDHIEVISNYAKLEFKHGEPQRGITMFENIVSNYPKRTDLWSVYIDMLTLQADVKPVRALFERVINLGLSTYKMKFFFKKYMEFEKKHGDEDSLDLVKQKAIDYVENKAAAVLTS